MKKMNRKGFTLVELVIVIAVIAILAAVLIPTFGNLIKKANISNDVGTIANLNKAMLIRESTEGKPGTMYEAILAAGDIGYSVEKLTPTTEDYYYCWNKTANKFFLVKEDFTAYDSDIKYINEDRANCWLIAQDANDLAEFSRDQNDRRFSVYLNYETTDAIDNAIVGIDVGNNRNINVKFIGKTATMRLGGGDLVVDNTEAVVHSYGEKTNVIIEHAAPSSYHEYDTVLGNIEVKEGRVVIEATAKAPTIIITATTPEEAAKVKVEVKSEQKVTVAPATAAAMEAMNTIVTDTEKVEKVEEIVQTSEDSVFAGGLGTQSSPYLISNAEEWANINTVCTSSNNKAFYFKQIADLEVSAVLNYFCGEYDGDGYSLSQTYAITENNKNYSVLFNAAGFISIKNLNVLMKNGYATTLASSMFYGAAVENVIFNATDELLAVNATNFGLITINPLYTSSGGTQQQFTYTFKDITNNVSFQNVGTSTGFLIGSGPCYNVKTDTYFENCVNNGVITGANTVGFLYGNATYMASVTQDMIFEVNNCKNNGILMSTTESGKAEFALMTTNHGEYGETLATNLNDTYKAASGGKYVAGSYLRDAVFTINQNGTSYSINTEDNTVNYKLAFSIAALYFRDDGAQWTEADTQALIESDYTTGGTYNVTNMSKYFIDLPINVSETGEVDKSVKAYCKFEAVKAGVISAEFNDWNNEGFAILVKDGETYIIVNTEVQYIDSTASVIVYAYEGETLVGSKSVK